MDQTPTPYQENVKKSSTSPSTSGHPGLTFVRRAHGVRAGKTFRLLSDGRVEKSDLVRLPEERLALAIHAPVMDVEHLAAILRRAATFPDGHVVLAALLPVFGGRVEDAPHAPLYRRKAENGGPFDPSTSTRILCLDVDGLRVPRALADKPRALADSALELLGLASGAGVVWQWSSSARLSPDEGDLVQARGRVWAVMSEALGCEDLRLWLHAHKTGSLGATRSWADPAVYSCSQPVYTTAPRFEGLQDPFPSPQERWVLLEGPLVDPLPVRAYIEARQEAQDEAQCRALLASLEAATRTTSSRTWSEGSEPGGRLADKIRARIEEHAASPPGARHGASIALAGWLVGLAEKGWLTLPQVEAYFSDAVRGFQDPAHHLKILAHVASKAGVRS